MRVINFMFATTYALSVISTPQREYVHGTAAHGAIKQSVYLGVPISRTHPIVIRSGFLHFLNKTLVFAIAAVAPDNIFRLCAVCDLIYPCVEG